MPTTWKNKIIKQVFNYADSTIKEMRDFFETRIENLEPTEDKKNASMASKTNKDRKSSKKRKRNDSYLSAIESSEELSVEHKPAKNTSILHKNLQSH